MAKRTHTLKSLAARQSFPKLLHATQNDLLEQPTTELRIECPIQLDAGMSQSSNTSHILTTLQSHMEKAAQLLKLEINDLQMWIDSYWEIPTSIQLSLLRLIITYELDPLLEEVAFTQYGNAKWQASITVNGWAKVANRCSTFSGVSFNQSEEENDQKIPAWMECTIQRSDRTTPITIREYFDEVKNDSEPWLRMPRRMLRHRAFQQCARIAFGI
jgi:hypothetical protein